jgi:nucleoside-diphosphate-sugar epimerase
MHVLVTGATGFLGSRAAGHLLEAGADVTALVRSGADRARLGALAPRARVVEGDVLAPGSELEALVRRVRPDACVHLAWYAVPGKYLDAPESFEHLEATLRLARALHATGSRRLVTAGTCFEYDTTIGTLSEVARTDPRYLYAACKLAVFSVLREASRLWDRSYCHLRFFHQYGPWENDGRLVPAVVRALLRGEEARVTAGEQVRDYLHVDDVGRAIAHAALAPLEGAVNVGSGVPVRVRDLVEAAARACGRPELVRFGAIPQRDGDPAVVCADASKLRASGWAPRWALDEGLADTVHFWRSR